MCTVASPCDRSRELSLQADQPPPALVLFDIYGMVPMRVSQLRVQPKIHEELLVFNSACCHKHHTRHQNRGIPSEPGRRLSEFVRYPPAQVLREGRR